MRTEPVLLLFMLSACDRSAAGTTSSASAGAQVTATATVAARPADDTFSSEAWEKSVNQLQLAPSRECNAAATTRNAQIRGNVVIECTISEQGKLTQSTVLQNDTKDTELERCLLRVYQGIAYPWAPRPQKMTFRNEFKQGADLAKKP